jgi:hypothetical protein
MLGAIMNPIKTLLLLISLCVAGAPVSAAIQSNLNQGIFTDVQGKVEVKAKKGHKTKVAKKDLTVFEGDRIITTDGSSAKLKLFDGSSLEIAPKTEFILSKLQKPAENEKVIKFKLIVGQLLAAVEKLTTSKSAFEIEAGGVVCGVRGTKFSMNCDGKSKPQVQLHVFEGVVYTVDGHGNKYFFHPGPPIKFVNSVTDDKGGQTGQDPNKGKGDNNGGSKGLDDMSHQFNNNVNLNQGKDLNQSQSNILTIKPYVGN